MLVFAAALATAGCVQRTISITSQPAGALVYLNDDEMGRTPLRVPFTFYGTYDVRLEREGYQPLWVKQKATPPLWEYPGPDLFAEAIPGAKVELKWHFDLEALPPAEDRDADALASRAAALRQQLADTPTPPELQRVIASEPADSAEPTHDAADEAPGADQ
jgi:hypothetical protein